MTQRDKWLAAMLPAMLTLLLGFLIFLRPAGREVSLLRNRVQNQGSPDARKAQLALADADRADLEKSIIEKRSLAELSHASFDRNRAMQEISTLCAVLGLSLNRSEPERGAKLPAALQETSPAFSSAGTLPLVWRLELSGAYPQVVKLLEGLQKAAPLIVPLNLTMSSGKTERTPANWSLTLWL